MATSLALARTSRLSDGRQLGRPAIGLIALATLLLALLLFAVTPLAGRAGFVVFTVALFTVALAAVSFAVEGRRRAADRLLGLAVRLAVLAALLPLVLVLSYTVDRGISKINPSFLMHSMKGVGPFDTTGGLYHAAIGTLEQVVLTMLIAVPLGLLVAVYLAEYGRGTFSTTVRFLVDVMTGIPSIVAGLFIYTLVVINSGPSGLAAALALAILMLPVVVRSAEEMLKLVPDALREASYALGVTPVEDDPADRAATASAGTTTGVMLAVARVTGETAPLLLTSQTFDSINTNPFSGRQSALSSYIYDQATSAGPGYIPRAWGAALVLIAIVLVLYVGARLLTRRNSLTRG